MTTSPHLVVIGGGAAGFFAAVNAARLQPGLRVTLVEKSNKLLSKVRVSGGGRCNVTHACFDAAELVKFYPRGGKELRGAFSRFGVKQTIAWFEARGVELKKEADGRMFPITDQSETIARCLLDEADKYGVRIVTQTEITNISKTEDGFVLAVRDGATLEASSVIVTSGGHPKQNGYDFLKNTGHTLVAPVPSLFTFNLPQNPVTKLMGVAVPQAAVDVGGTKLEETGPVLITHWGMSGPAILKTSAWGARELANRNYEFEAGIHWIPDRDEDEIYEHLLTQRRDHPARQFNTTVCFGLPSRLWYFLLDKAEIQENIRWADCPNQRLKRLAQLLYRDVYQVKGKTTFKEEFVTAGGILLREIDFKMMQSKLIPHLYFAGEVLDIDGVTGGFNFQAAWTTAWLAACAVAGLDAQVDLV